jgi:hypothetical protein
VFRQICESRKARTIAVHATPSTAADDFGAPAAFVRCAFDCVDDLDGAAAVFGFVVDFEPDGCDIGGEGWDGRREDGCGAHDVVARRSNGSIDA